MTTNNSSDEEYDSDHSAFDLAYETPGGLDPYLAKVDGNVGNKLGELIKACLTAKNFHYKKMFKMFEEATIYV
ncbi:MAG: hypothetical protein ABIJ21_03155 [Nanoarchaeota archaeon]